MEKDSRIKGRRGDYPQGYYCLEKDKVLSPSKNANPNGEKTGNLGTMDTRGGPRLPKRQELPRELSMGKVSPRMTGGEFREKKRGGRTTGEGKGLDTPPKEGSGGCPLRGVEKRDRR